MQKAEQLTSCSAFVLAKIDLMFSFYYMPNLGIKELKDINTLDCLPRFRWG
jgi:hypothetical protein